MVQIVCPACLSANRVPDERLGDGPKCGRCGAPLAAGEPVALDAASFDAVVAGTGLPVVVDFWAPWCAPCRAMAPQFERAAALLKSRARFAKVNTEEAPSLAARLRIQAIPTLVLFEHGAEVKRVSGLLDAGTLVKWVQTHEPSL